MGEFVVLTRQLVAIGEQAGDPTGGGGAAAVEEEEAESGGDVRGISVEREREWGKWRCYFCGDVYVFSSSHFHFRFHFHFFGSLQQPHYHG